MNKIELIIEHNGLNYQPVVEEPISWETERQGVPGKLTFSVQKDAGLNFQEGDHLMLYVNKEKVFYGFIFTKKRNKDGLISVTAYDQLRYLKNKDVIKYKEITASALIQKLAKIFGMEVGEIEDTKYVIADRLEQDKTLFDIIKNALNETQQAKKELYVLYDDCRKLTLKNIKDMKLDILINQNTAEDFDYASSIDSKTYNRIKLFYESEKTGDLKIHPQEDAASIKRWGVLQHTEKVDNPQNAEEKAKNLLSMYNRKTRNLSVSKAFGDIRVRGGSLLSVSLDLGDVVANTYMIVEKVKHTISADVHQMDLSLIGGDFSA
ncbi:XkdQ/YqbQ family protein [Sinanaerobacter sp. ZZT-01]|uniref:XkdQ/YqbQ family protein n=1 Tax=Sinanaerobacter sp. ZZT-01 TaxID=3111540 RepID=UPI002D76F824|nr:hydrolase [Sinanaerobacter sp. ZZT-01]WRR94087.1 hydrolase [Sinanaerobacter sp. ZZT-01]